MIGPVPPCKDLFVKGGIDQVPDLRSLGQLRLLRLCHQHIELTVSKSRCSACCSEARRTRRAALDRRRTEMFDVVVAPGVANDLASSPEESISVREKWRQKRRGLRRGAACLRAAYPPWVVAATRWFPADAMGQRAVTPEAYELADTADRHACGKNLLTGRRALHDYRINLLDASMPLQCTPQPRCAKRPRLRRSRGAWKD